MKHLLMIALIIAGMAGGALMAQTDGSTMIIQDPAIDTILQKHIEMNEALLLNTDNYYCIKSTQMFLFHSL